MFRRRRTIPLLILGAAATLASVLILKTVDLQSRSTGATLVERWAAATVAAAPAESPAAGAISAPAPTTPAASNAQRKAGPVSARDGNGQYWVQVGAYREDDVARHVAAKLREWNFRVPEPTVTKTNAGASRPAVAAERYEIVVVTGPKDEVAKRLAAKQLSIDPTEDGLRVKPALPLEDAVAVSKELAGAGYKVRLKRAREPQSAAPTQGPEPITWYRVRVGPFSDRTTAQETLRQLTERGYTPFVAFDRP